ncbi:vegetative cell wall protein gp1-like [Felis catus]|uniref:vegetative cell wall protein gp1-like n=1 Tax=Felis catus TaxID=9685 RepID=UPI001D19E11B|nr:vegetative cell wall protein gp1-like [Felis catus]
MNTSVFFNPADASSPRAGAGEKALQPLVERRETRRGRSPGSPRPAPSAVTRPGRELPPPPAAPRPPPPPLAAPPVPASFLAPAGPARRCPGRRRACGPPRREPGKSTSAAGPLGAERPRGRRWGRPGRPGATVPAPAAAVASARIRARLRHRAIILGRAVTSPGHRLRRRLPEVSLRTAGHARRAHAHTRTARPVPPAHTPRVPPRALLRSHGRRPRAPSTVPGTLRPHVCPRKRLPPARTPTLLPQPTSRSASGRAPTPARARPSRPTPWPTPWPHRRHTSALRLSLQGQGSRLS